jgi:hypothetical protein
VPETDDLEAQLDALVFRHDAEPVKFAMVRGRRVM